MKKPSANSIVIKFHKDIERDDKKNIFEEFNYNIKPNGHYSQILIKMDDIFNSIGMVKKIIEDLEIRILETEQISSDCVLFKLDVKDIRNVSLKITENGFLNFKGINALPPKK